MFYLLFISFLFAGLSTSLEARAYRTPQPIFQKVSTNNNTVTTTYSHATLQKECPSDAQKLMQSFTPQKKRRSRTWRIIRPCLIAAGIVAGTWVLCVVVTIAALITGAAFIAGAETFFTVTGLVAVSPLLLMHAIKS